jgi:lipoprotein NlpI
MREALEQKETTSRVIALGVAYLWAERFQAAWEHFNAANVRRPSQISVYYGMAGVAKWCMGAREEAVAQWQAGLKSGYADAAGGVTTPLLLYTASVLDPHRFSRARAEKLLTIRANDPRARIWPGAVAEFLLGRINEAELRSRCADRSEGDAYMARWRADFYFGIHAFMRGDLAFFHEMMCKVIAIDDDDFDLKKHFVRKFWHEEFFLARNLVLNPAGKGNP